MLHDDVVEYIDQCFEPGTLARHAVDSTRILCLSSLTSPDPLRALLIINNICLETGTRTDVLSTIEIGECIKCAKRIYCESMYNAKKLCVKQATEPEHIPFHMLYCERFASEYVARLLDLLISQWVREQDRAQMASECFFAFNDLITVTTPWDDKALAILVLLARKLDFPADVCLKVLKRCVKYERCNETSRLLIGRLLPDETGSFGHAACIASILLKARNYALFDECKHLFARHVPDSLYVPFLHQGIERALPRVVALCLDIQPCLDMDTTESKRRTTLDDALVWARDAGPRETDDASLTAVAETLVAHLRYDLFGTQSAEQTEWPRLRAFSQQHHFVRRAALLRIEPHMTEVCE